MGKVGLGVVGAPRDFLSNTMHVKLRMNLRRPRRKPKYSLATDSEPVPRGKGEKNRCERSEIVPEMMCLQGVGAGPSLLAEKARLKFDRRCMN